MKVIFVNATSEVGGADLSLLTLVRHMPNEIDKVVVLPKPGPYSEEFSRYSRVEYLPLHKLKKTSNVLWHLRWIFLVPATLWRYTRLFRREKADVIHLNSSVLSLAGIASWWCHQRIVWHVREVGLLPRWGAWILRWLIQRLADDIICISQAVASEFTRQNHLHVIYNGVESVGSNSPMTRDGLVIGVLCRWVPFKGIENAIRVMKEVIQALPEVKLRIAGGVVQGHEAYADYLRTLADAELPAESVEFSGWVKNSSEWLQRIDVLLHLPRDPEPLGRVILEAALANVPSVAFASGGLPETIRDGETGYLVTSNEQAVERVVDLLKDSTLRQRMGEAAHRWVSETFSVQQYCDRVCAIYFEGRGVKK